MLQPEQNKSRTVVSVCGSTIYELLMFSVRQLMFSTDRWSNVWKSKYMNVLKLSRVHCAQNTELNVMFAKMYTSALSFSYLYRK